MRSGAARGSAHGRAGRGRANARRAPIAGRNDIRVTWPRRETDRPRPLRHRLRPRRPGARSDDRRHHHADLPDLDLRAGGTRPHKGFEYGRTQNPTRMALEGNVAAIEAGRAGVRLRLGDGGDRRRAHPARSRAITWWSATTPTAAPSGCSSGCGASSASTSPTSTPRGSRPSPRRSPPRRSTCSWSRRPTRCCR